MTAPTSSPPLQRPWIASLGGPGVLMVDQPFGGGDEIFVRLGPIELDGRLVPFLAIFTAAADVGDRVNAPHLHPIDDRDAECGGDRDVESAVAVEQGRVVAAERQPFLGGDEHRNLGAVLAGVENLLRLIKGRIELDFRLFPKRRFCR